jgi:hypothetical protein
MTYKHFDNYICIITCPDTTALKCHHVIPRPPHGVVVLASHHMPERPLSRNPPGLPGYLTSLHDRLFVMSAKRPTLIQDTGPRPTLRS